MTRRISTLLSTVAVAALIGGCSLLTSVPEPVDVGNRIAALETAGLDVAAPVEIRWNEHMVPWITAESDADGAYALGYVHAHLRLGQMEILRRAASGRLAEVAGPLAADLDQTLRTIGYRRAAEANYPALPVETKLWLDRFAEGVNAYVARLDELPHEYRLFAFEPKPWSAIDVLAFGRLAGSDVNWLVSIGLLGLTDREDWPEIWDEVMRFNGGSLPSIADLEEDRDGGRLLAALLFALGGDARAGSNAWAVSGARTASGAPMLATDPHLGITVPNIWLLAGLKTPSLEVVGMMPAGMPVFGLGRNRHLAWGATNLRARSSDLIDVSALPDSAFTTVREEVPIRFGFDRDIEIRVSPYGPVITDAPMVDDPRGRQLALRWVGQGGSDELSAYMDAARANDVGEFRAAMEGFAIPGLAFVLAAADGDIAIGTAARLPARPHGAPDDLVVQPPASGEADPWNTLLTASSLPWIVNPEKGFVASANNPTAEAVTPLTIFDTPPDRISVIESHLRPTRNVDREFMAKLQRNTHSPSAVVLRDTIVEAAEKAGLGSRVPDELAQWNGDYEADSRGALLLEGMIAGIATPVYEALGEVDVLEVVSRWAWFRMKLARDLLRLTPEQARAALEKGFEEMEAAGEEFAVWGDMHRLQLRHPLANAPLIGGRYVFGDVPAGGSNETVMKSAHSPASERHWAFYGSQARQISDMADPDENHFVLLGGQDGWLNAEGFSDQLPLWQRGDYIRLPLTRKAVEAAFPTVTVLRPRK